MRFTSARPAICLTVLALPLVCTHSAHGGSGAVFTLPQGPPNAVKGLRLSVDSRWAQGFGYLPVRIGVSCTPPPAGDRTLTVEVGAARHARDGNSLTAAAEIDIPAGSTAVSRVIAVPQLGYMQSLSLRVWEDGELLEDLSVENYSIVAGLWVQDPSAPRILFVGSGPLDASQFSFALSTFGQQYNISRPADAATFDQRSPDELVENWINYGGLDLVFVSLADVRDLAARRPGVWRALRDWTRTGGNLCIFGVGTDWHGLEELEEKLGCPATEKQAAGPFRGWDAASRDVFRNHVIAGMTTTGRFPNASVGLPRQKPVAPKVAPFVLKGAAFGRVVAIAEAQPFPGEEAVWRWVLASLGPRRTAWPARHGTAPGEHNVNFNDFLIADVGLPPIQMYRVLITVFVVLIGPVNYWVLKRRGRLHLFLFTVPLAALMTSAALLGYALVADGLSSRLRARSLTYLDQRGGDAVRLARISYYAGLAPSAGLEFPGDLAIAPLELNATGSFGRRGRHMVWDQRRQHLTRGWLASRTPTQYVTTRADKTRGQLTIVPTGDASRVTIQNGLGVQVKQLIWSDATGGLHRGLEIDAGDETTLEPLDSEEAIDLALDGFGLALVAHWPSLPDAASTLSPGTFFPARRRYRRQNAAVATSTSLLEEELDRVATDLMSRNLAPRSYLAIVERPAEIAVGTHGFTESQSLHVIRGQW